MNSSYRKRYSRQINFENLLSSLQAREEANWHRDLPEMLYTISAVINLYKAYPPVADHPKFEKFLERARQLYKKTEEATTLYSSQYQLKELLMLVNSWSRHSHHHRLEIACRMNPKYYGKATLVDKFSIKAIANPHTHPIKE